MGGGHGEAVGEIVAAAARRVGFEQPPDLGGDGVRVAGPAAQRGTQAALGQAESVVRGGVEVRMPASQAASTAADAASSVTGRKRLPMPAAPNDSSVTLTSVPPSVVVLMSRPAGRSRSPCMPPSTASAVPVMDAGGGARQVGDRRAATSSAVTSRPVGWRASSAARSAAGSSAASSSRPTQGVSAVPGLTQLTRMPSRTWSAAIARVSDSTAPLLARVQRALRQARRWRAIEQVLTTAACDERAQVRQGGPGDADHAERR